MFLPDERHHPKLRKVQVGLCSMPKKEAADIYEVLSTKSSVFSSLLP